MQQYLLVASLATARHAIVATTRLDRTIRIPGLAKKKNEIRIYKIMIEISSPTM
jgi:hypothetical protein